VRSEEECIPLCSGRPIDILLVVSCTNSSKTSSRKLFSLQVKRPFNTTQDLQRNVSNDSGITLLLRNNTMCLRLNNLKPSDTVNYTCACTFDGGVDYLDLVLIGEVGKCLKCTAMGTEIISELSSQYLAADKMVDLSMWHHVYHMTAVCFISVNTFFY